MHIVWLILKIIGAILGVLLGLLLVLIVLVLIVPLRYKLHLQVGGKTDVDSYVSWLFHLVHITIQYKEKKTKYCLRIFGLPVRKNKEENENQKVSQARKSKKQKKKNKGKTKTSTLKQTDSKQQSQKRNDKSAAKNEKRVAKEESAAKAEERKRESKCLENGQALNENDSTEKNSAGDSNAVLVFFHKVKDWIKKLKRMLLHIPEAWAKIKNKISEFKKKKDKILKFLKDEGNKNSVKKLKKRTFEVLRYIGPRKLTGYVRFGTGDPSSTGKVLGIISILSAYVKMKVSVYPDFEEKRIEADITAQGRMRVIRFLRVGGSLYFDKEVKKFFADGKQLKEELNG